MITTTISRALLACMLVAAAVALAACGGDGRGDENRPPLVLTIAVQIGEDEVTASPQKFGAGPITLIATNQTSVPQKLKIDGPRVERVLPVDASDTANVKLKLEPGDYELTTESSRQVPPYALHVGAKRGSAQNRLLLP